MIHHKQENQEKFHTIPTLIIMMGEPKTPEKKFI